MTDISLTVPQRSNLLTLKEIDSLSSRTQLRLTSGEKVSEIIHDPVAYFQASALKDMADDINGRVDEMNQAISAISATLDAIDAIDTFLKQMRGISENTKQQSVAQRTQSTLQFVELLKQIHEIAEDASYNGTNLINNTSANLDVAFSNRTASVLSIGAIDLTTTKTTTGVTNRLFSTATFVASAAATNFSNVATDLFQPAGTTFIGFSLIGDNNSQVALVNVGIKNIDNAIDRLQAHAEKFGTNSAILTTRLEFSNKYINELRGGADKLTLADLNEESANLTALRTRHQLGIEALRVAGDQLDNIIRILQ